MDAAHEDHINGRCYADLRPTGLSSPLDENTRESTCNRGSAGGRGHGRKCQTVKKPRNPRQEQWPGAAVRPAPPRAWEHTCAAAGNAGDRVSQQVFLLSL